MLIKDNIETRDPMPTTAGSSALLNNFSEEDSPVIAKLRSSGAMFGQNEFKPVGQLSIYSLNKQLVSGWRQVKNHTFLTALPAARFGLCCSHLSAIGAAALGTETNGSIICPAHVNSIVGFKPTVGLLPTDGIVPISKSQDTAGPDQNRGRRDDADGCTHGRQPLFTGRASHNEELRIGVLRFSQGDTGISNNLTKH